MREILKLKKSNCKNCYKCIRHCPVKSIRVSGNQAHIINDECILCGQCFVVCPQGAKQIESDIEKVKVMLYGKEPVIASLAPSFIANYGGAGIKSLSKALKKLGFHSAEETAIGATMVKNEYENILAKKEHDILISSSCHSVNLLIQKHFPSALKYLANVMSPMQAHCRDIKKRYPGAKTVFIGPCVSKKDEAQRYPDIVDAVLTFEELTQWFKEEKITVEPEKNKTAEGKARFFPTSGGILKTMRGTAKKGEYKYIAVDGTEACIDALNDIKDGNIFRCFIEMSACKGSCIGGPIMEKYNRSPIKGYMQVAAYAGEKDFKVEDYSGKITQKRNPLHFNKKEIPPHEIEEILKQMGKTKPEHELNCASCGYNTCREKAAAVYLGNANISMCLPFLKDKAESFSDNIINNTPNAILVLNENLEIQQINRSACKLMNIAHHSYVLGEPVVRILDPQIFMQVRDSGASVRERITYLSEYKKYVEKTVLYDRDFHILICIMRDITAEKEEEKKKEELRRKTIETADNVADKQMRIVQEIASLLGETVAETKTSLTKLKESINDE
ncbi:Putative PAS/PAC sensor protein [Elusimicrobium minutum Pei191]|uniref:Putative PAS/PAC sensor protein n=1 Tax=Elusimicrobium minutum (strain Pei191) TaxID=445932 RepID=B2KCR1_ELUMP|nr:[Fe-Fe] hydrogenase large subunit C-terminal domain-containing protein [Elusimicrobium minutum]ACC98307.1 Putative PAS/PAC sensor protein [Elusimicrobium minutum Pei191]